MTLMQEFTKGIIKENPLFRLVLGTCPALAVTTSVENGIGMGAAFTGVLLASNIVISAMRSIIPASVRIPAYVVIIASFVTMIDQLMHAFTPSLYKALGIFIPLIVVNCIILGRAEAFASRNSIIPSIMDALGMGLGFTIALAAVSTFREVLGAGTFLGIQVLPESIPAILMILPPGGFITLGCLLALLNKLQKKYTW
ncbi:MAG: electron transport complex subunit E [Desulfuromonadaceae bacterium]|nr:electron transport complex subunit E [Desulfuromonadaceae bacterium]MDD2855235.1 electron transport complex subunit E [Desulfuromonadaceae bacterium]